RELHDEIGQALTAVKIRLQAAQRRLHNGAAAPDLGEDVEIVEDAIQRVRNRSLDLRPSLLDDLGLIPTIRWFLERHASHAGLTAELAAEPLVPRPPAEVETSCFRVVQEAVTNAIRHAHARNLRIELGARAGRLELSIRDDGVGFNVASARRRALEGGSIGLLGMEERVELLGGRIEIDSGLGRGTLIRVTLPVPDDGGGAGDDGFPGGGPQ
ncbi:MAG TPA: sensor histidine kinase, partial [Burkholderiales bacterium]